MTTKKFLLTCVLTLFCINLSYARWFTTDPKAQKYYATSPYAYCLNNPIKFIDPNGMEIHLYEVASYRNRLSYFGQGTIDNDRMRSIGGFEISPYLDKNGEILGWSAYRNGRVQYVMDNPADIDVFSKNVSSFGVAADLFYMNGTPGQGKVAMAAGDIGAGLLQQWDDALRNPGYYMYAANALGMAAMTVGNTTTNIYRVYGGDSKAAGYSWTPVNPNSVINYRGAAGLPSGGTSGFNNTGRFVIEGTVKNKYILQVRPAQSLDGYPGGLKEFIIEPGKVNIKRVSGANPQF